MKGIIDRTIEQFKGDINLIIAYLRLKRIKVTKELLEKRIENKRV